MSYVNAEDVLPKTLIEEIQKHVDGQLIYIPRKKYECERKTIFSKLF